MANWTTSVGVNSNVTAGTETTITDLAVTISPAEGYSITPENFIIGGAGTFGGTNQWWLGNTDPIVLSVIFTQNNNDVIATANLIPTVFDADTVIRIDIDESTTNPVTLNDYGVCTKVQYPYSAISTSTIVTSATETLVQNGSASQPNIKSYKHFENNLSSFPVFQLTVDPPSTHSIINPTINISSEIEGFEGAFTLDVNSPTTGDNKIFSVYYTEPEGGGSYTPCDFGHLVTIDYTEQLIGVADTNDIDSVNVEADIGNKGGETTVTVIGAADAEYKMTIQNSTNSYWYNFSTEEFQANTAEYSGTVQSNSTEQLQVLIPGSDTSTDYNVALAPHASSTIRAGASGQIKQYGTNTLTITPITDSSTHYGTPVPANLVVKRPVRYTGDYYTDSSVDIINVKGLTDGSSTRVDITSRNPGVINRLKSGMAVAGDDIPHGTTIKDVNRQYMTLSAAVNLTASTSLKCAADMADVVPFSFSIPRGTSGRSLSLNTTNKYSNAIWGFNDATATVVNAQTTSVDIIVDSTYGIAAGMTAIGTGITAENKVSSVDHVARTVTLEAAHSGVADDAVIIFKSSNPSIKTINIRAIKESNNIVVSGYLLVPKLATSAAADIFLDKIITST